MSTFLAERLKTAPHQNWTFEDSFAGRASDFIHRLYKISDLIKAWVRILVSRHDLIEEFELNRLLCVSCSRNSFWRFDEIITSVIICWTVLDEMLG